MSFLITINSVRIMRKTGGKKDEGRKELMQKIFLFHFIGVLL